MLDVIYEDNHLLVCIKPQNIPSQKDSSEDVDMITLCKDYLRQKYNKMGNIYVGLLHRLDRPTGGIMVFAKTSKCAKRMTEQIKNHEFEKNYLAVVLGNVRENQGHLVHYLKKDEKNNIVSIVPKLEEGAKYAELIYNVLEKNSRCCLVDIKLLTGRSHQIRVQLSSIKNPIFGDSKYGGKVVDYQNLALWAYKVKFTHPVSKKPMTFVCSPPSEIIPWKFFNLQKYMKY